MTANFIGDTKLLREMFLQGPGFMALLTGPEHRLQLVNPAYFDLVGHRQVIGKTVREAFPDLADQGFFELLDAAYASGEAFTGTAMPIAFKRSVDSVAQPRFIDFVYQPIRDEAGDVVGIFAQGYDVTDKIIAEEELRNSEWMLRQITDALPMAVVVIDIFGIYRAVNRYFCESYNLQEADIIGRSVREIIGEAAYSHRKPYIARVLAGEVVNFEIEAVLYSGENRIVAVQYIPRKASNNEVVGYYMTALNISVQRGLLSGPILH